MRLSNSFQQVFFVLVLVIASSARAQVDAIPHITASEATNYLNQRVIVVDKVVQVGLRSNIWLLHLNQKYPKSPLNAVIRKGYTNSFPNISQYLGERVQLSGQISEYHGRLELALTDPSQIQIVGYAPAQPAVATSVSPAQLAPASSGPVVASPAPASGTVPNPPDSSTGTLKWILGLLVIISALLAAGIFRLWKRPNTDARAGAGKTDQLIALDEKADAGSAESWKQRALVAEAMAGKQGELLREKIVPELTEFARQSLVQGLYAQRNLLLETQQKAQMALAELEARLQGIQAPLQERIRVYEDRIAQLEREVETQGDEMRELTRATLALVRRKLEDERASERSLNRFN